MRPVMAMVALILAMAVALSAGLGSRTPCPMMTANLSPHDLHHMTTADDDHGRPSPSPSHDASDFCKQACLSSLLPQPAAAMPVVLTAVSVPEPAEPALPASLRADLSERPPKPLV